MRALRADLEKSASAVGADVKLLDETLQKVEQTSEPCEAATGLADFSTAVSGVADLRPEDVERLARDGERLRGQVLAAMPDEEGCEGPVTFFVDPERAVPVVPSLPGFDGKTPRPVAGMIDSSGARSGHHRRRDRMPTTIGASSPRAA